MPGAELDCGQLVCHWQANAAVYVQRFMFRGDTSNGNRGAFKRCQPARDLLDLVDPAVGIRQQSILHAGDNVIETLAQVTNFAVIKDHDQFIEAEFTNR